MAEYFPVCPHGDVEEIAANTFMVRGSMKMNPVLRISRNMGIVRSGDEVSLINPIRLDSKGESQLRKLGKVTNIIRLGSFHGIDDPYYKDKFAVRLWAQPGGKHYTEPPLDVELGSETALPFENARLFEFSNTVQPESVLHLESDGGILFTCDAIQHYGDYSYNNLPAKLLMPFIGFPRTTIIGPFWLKLMTPEGASLESEFQDLLMLEFDKLLSAHGTLITGGAHAAVQEAVARAFTDQGKAKT